MKVGDKIKCIKGQTLRGECWTTEGKTYTILEIALSRLDPKDRYLVWYKSDIDDETSKCGVFLDCFSEYFIEEREERY